MMLTREEINKRVQHYLSMLPDTMTRRQVEEWIRKQLGEALVLDQASRRGITIWWDGDELRVELPSRLHYLDSLEDITNAVDDAVSRVDVTDTTSLTTEEFSERMARLRGKK